MASGGGGPNFAGDPHPARPDHYAVAAARRGQLSLPSATSFENVSGSWMAISESALRSSATIARCRPEMNSPYLRPRWRQAALMRMIQSRRNSRLRTRRSRNANTPARIRVIFACLTVLCRPRRKPLVSFIIRLRLRMTVLPLRARTMTQTPQERFCEASLTGSALAHRPQVFSGDRIGQGRRLAELPLPLRRAAAEQVPL